MNNDHSDLTASKSSGRPLLSLCILVHFFFVFVALSANLSPSPLQARLLRRFGFYTQLLNIDPNFAPYYLTHAMESDVDHRVEIITAETAPEPTIQLPPDGFHGGENYQRQQRLARAMAFVSEDEALAGQLARAVGEYAVRQRGVTPQQVRVRRHLLQDPDVVTGGTPEQRDPDSALYYRTPYAANCVVIEGGRVQVVKVEQASQVAQPAAATNEERPGNGS